MSAKFTPTGITRTVDFKLSGNPLADSFSLNSDWAIFDLLAP